MAAFFAPIPTEAMRDTRLSASHWRLLAAIASHDRMNKNGAGCYAATARLADEAAVHYTNVARLAANLEAWGYIVVARHNLNRRLRTYRLIYNGKITIVGETANIQTSNVIEGQDFGGSTNNATPIVGEQNFQVPDGKREPPSKYIPLSGGKKFRETVDRSHDEKKLGEARLHGEPKGKHLDLPDKRQSVGSAEPEKPDYAPLADSLGWPVVMAAYTPDDENHAAAVGACRREAERLGISWSPPGEAEAA